MKSLCRPSLHRLTTSCNTYDGCVAVVDPSSSDNRKGDGFMSKLPLSGNSVEKYSSYLIVTTSCFSCIHIYNLYMNCSRSFEISMQLRYDSNVEEINELDTFDDFKQFNEIRFINVPNLS